MHTYFSIVSVYSYCLFSFSTTLSSFSLSFFSSFFARRGSEKSQRKDEQTRTSKSLASTERARKFQFFVCFEGKRCTMGYCSLKRKSFPFLFVYYSVFPFAVVFPCSFHFNHRTAKTCIHALSNSRNVPIYYSRKS